jgi:hypothetical protein
MSELFKSGKLTLEVEKGNSEINIKWIGKSDDRNPGNFIYPILLDNLKVGTETNMNLILDFQNLEFMNSSTITPIVKILQEAKNSSNSVKIIYSNSLKWQELSFSALEIFETNDKRIEIRGV